MANHRKIDMTTTPGLLEFGGSNTPGYISNLGVTYASSTLTITDAQGAALTADNPGWVTVPSTTAGTYKSMEVAVATHFFIDDGGASDIIGEEFGATTGIAWGNPRPFFLYACMEDADAGVKFAISPNPCATVVPATADIGYHANPATNQTDNTFFFLNATDPTTAYDGNPCVKIGAINMTMSAADDWTVQALATVPSGIGPDKILAHHSATWTMPVNQNGAIEGTYLYVAGGDASGDVPKWTTTTYGDYYYWINENGSFDISFSTINEGNCVNGDVTATLNLALPFMPTKEIQYGRIPAGLVVYGAGVGEALIGALDPTTTLLYLADSTGAAINADGFSNAADDINLKITGIRAF